MTRKIRRTRNKSSRKSIRGKRTNRKVRVSHRKNTNRKNTYRKNTNRKTSRNYRRKMLQIGGAGEGQGGNVDEGQGGNVDEVLQAGDVEGESLSQLRGKQEQKQEKIGKQKEQIEKLKIESSNLNIINKLDILLDKMWNSSCKTDQDDSFKQIVDAIQTQINKDYEELKILNEKIKNKDIEFSESIKPSIRLSEYMINGYNQNVDILRKKKNDGNLDKYNTTYKGEIISLIDTLKHLDLFKQEDIEKNKTDEQTWDRYYRGQLADYDEAKGLIEKIDELTKLASSELAKTRWRFAITSKMAAKRFHRNDVGDAEEEGGEEDPEEDEEEDEEEEDEEEGDEEVDRNYLRQFIFEDITPEQTEELKRRGLEIINRNTKILLAYGFIDEYILRVPNISEEDKDKIEGYKDDEKFQDDLFIYWRNIKNIEDKKRKKVMLLKFVKGYPNIPPDLDLDPAQAQVEEEPRADPAQPQVEGEQAQPAHGADPAQPQVEGEQEPRADLDPDPEQVIVPPIGGGKKSKVLTIDELEEFNKRIKTIGGDPNGEVERAINGIKEIRDVLKIP